MNEQERKCDDMISLIVPLPPILFGISDTFLLKFDFDCEWVRECALYMRCCLILNINLLLFFFCVSFASRAHCRWCVGINESNWSNGINSFVWLFGCFTTHNFLVVFGVFCLIVSLIIATSIQFISVICSSFRFDLCFVVKIKYIVATAVPNGRRKYWIFFFVLLLLFISFLPRFSFGRTANIAFEKVSYQDIKEFGHVHTFSQHCLTSTSAVTVI